MKITNEKNLPQSVVNAVDPNPHNRPGCLSVTTLLKGAKEVILTMRHWDEITVDVADRAFAVLGTAAHLVFENAADGEGVHKEMPVEYQVGNYTVTGRIDYYDTNTRLLGDYKTTSVYKVQDGVPEEWRMQALMYAWLLSLRNMPVEKVTFFVFLRDWRRSEWRAKRTQGYPDAQTVTLSFDVTKGDVDMAGKFIASRTAEIWEAKKRPDDEIPPCSEAERWARPTTYAVRKQGLKTAVRGASRFTTEAAAQAFIDAQAKDREKLSIEKRDGCSPKCEDYCDCCQFCSFWKENVRPKLEAEESISA